MKNRIILLLLTLLWLVNCSTKETKQDKETSTTSEKPKEEQIFDLDGKFFWEGNGASIKIIDEEKPKVLFTNFKGINEHPFKRIKLVNNEIGYLVSGTIKTFGDLDKDGMPEFLIAHITTKTDYYYGFRMVVSIANNSINNLTYAPLDGIKLKCSSIVGKDINFEFDSLSEGGPYLIKNIKHGFLNSYDKDCKNFEQGVSKPYYTLQKGKTSLQYIETQSCPIENNTIRLATLYNLEPSLWGSYFRFDKYSFTEIITPNLNICGEDGSMGIGHIEKLAGIRLEGGNAKKRTDLMPAIEEEFLNVNPSFIAWVRENLIPKPNKKQNNGLSYGFIYNKAIQTNFRSYALTRLFIEQEDKEFLLREYSEAKATINNNSPSRETPESESNLIFDRSDWANEQLEKLGLGDIEDFTIYGFWIRRMLGGSEPEIWKTLKYILKMYDGEWYENISIYGMTKIDSATFYKKRAISGIDNIIKGKEAIPDGILTETDAQYVITTRNGKVINYFKTNNSTDMEADYSVYGYWVPEQKILVSYSTMDSDEKFSIDINNGERSSTANYFYPSKDGLYMAERTEELDPNFDGIDYIAKLRLTKKDGTQLAQYTGVWAQNGFWVEDEFYFENNQRNFLKIGKVGFDEIQPYTSPLLNNPIKTDSIPPNTEIE